MTRKFSDLEEKMSRESIRRSDKKYDNATKAILETAHDMREAGVMDEETYARIIARHKEEKAG